jgi:hypothetical protein
MADILVRVIDAYVFRRTEEGLRFLLLKRAQTKKYEHFWQGVAGKIEEYETAWEAAVRELKEFHILLFSRPHPARNVRTFWSGPVLTIKT